MPGYVYRGTIHDTQPTQTEADRAEYVRRHKNRPKTMRPGTAEKLKQAEILLTAGASQVEVNKQTGLSRATIRQYFPGQGWSKAEAAKYGNAQRNERREVP